MQKADDLVDGLEDLFSDITVPEPTIASEELAAPPTQEPTRPGPTPQEALRTPSPPAPAAAQATPEEADAKLAQQLRADPFEGRREDQRDHRPLKP